MGKRTASGQVMDLTLLCKSTAYVVVSVLTAASKCDVGAP